MRIVATGTFLALAVFSQSSAWAHDVANCRRLCDLTAPPGQAAVCAANYPCSKFAGGTHDPESVVWAKAKRYNDANYLRGSQYEGKMAGGTWNADGGCGAKPHSAGLC